VAAPSAANAGRAIDSDSETTTSRMMNFVILMMVLLDGKWVIRA
jgi:hypothetical protein